MAALITSGLGSEFFGAICLQGRLRVHSLVALLAFLGLLPSIPMESVLSVEPFTENMLNRRARMESAIKAIPLDRLDRTASDAIRDVLNNPSFFRQMPQRTLDCDPQLLTFMVRHPEVMVNIWELIGITNITASRTGPNTFFADDGAGTKCNCELVYSDDSLHVYYGTGNYEGMLVPRSIKGRVVCVLRSQSHPNGNGHCGYSVNSNMDVFVKVDNIGADLLTRTLGPLVGRVTEHNFEETSKFVGQFSEFCATYPKAVQNLASHLNIQDESIRQEFVAVTARIGRTQEQVRYTRASPGSVSQDGWLAPGEIASEELRDSLGHIHLATLPDLMATNGLPVPSNAIDADKVDSEAGVAEPTTGWVPLRDTAGNQDIHRAQRSPTSSSQPLARDQAVPSSTIAPRRSGISLRR